MLNAARTAARRLLPWLVLAVAFPALAAENPREDLGASVAQLRRLEGEIRDRTLPLLVMLRKIESAEAPVAKVRVLRDQIPVRETNDARARVIAQARRDEELVQLERKETWIRVRLPDRREGWVSAGVVQTVARRSAGQKQAAWTPSEQRDLIAITAEMLKEIDVRHDTATVIVTAARATQGGVAVRGSRADTLALAAERSYAEISRLHAYAHHFHAKYAAEVQPLARGQGPPIDGQVAIGTGRTSYSAFGDESQFSRDLDFTGGMRLGERSRLTAALSHKNELIQSPFGTTDLRVGHATTSAAGARLASYVALSSYDDRVSDRNSFGRVGAGVDHERALGASTLRARVEVDRKSYQQNNPSDYQSALVDLDLLRRKEGGRELELGVDGLVQSSDASYLDFKRVAPQLAMRRTDAGGSFAMTAGLEWIGFAAEASGNDYTREQVDFRWARPGGDRSLGIAAKQFPSNADQGYVQLAGQNGWRSTGPASSARTDLSLIATVFPQGGTQSHYVDLRADRSSVRGRRSFDLSVFGRVWTEADPELQRDHTIDLESRYGWTFPEVRIGRSLGTVRVGPVLGAHLALAPERKAIARPGNDLRVGLEAAGNTMLGATALRMAVRHDRSRTYSNEITVDPLTGVTTLGALKTRMPTTTQITAGANVPLRDALELRVDLSRYSVNLDIDPTLSIDPIQNRTRFALTATLGYRFGL